MYFFFFFSLTQFLDKGNDEVVDPIVFPESEIGHNTDVVDQNSVDVINENNIPNDTFLSNTPKDSNIDFMNEATIKNKYMMSIAQVNSEDCGVPMSIFDNVYINLFKYFL